MAALLGRIFKRRDAVKNPDAVKSPQLQPTGCTGDSTAPSSSAASGEQQRSASTDTESSSSECGTLEGPWSGLSTPPGAAPCRARRGALDLGHGAGARAGADAGAAPPAALSSPPPPARAPRPQRLSDADGAELEALFTDVCLLHRGRHAMVYRARERAGRRPVVLKAYDPRRLAALDREVALLRAAGHHPGIVALERVVTAGGTPHVVLEACAGGTLIEAVANSGGRLPERVAARRVVAPLLRALAHLHERGIVHRDLKPEHVLLTPDGLRVADFASAALLPQKLATGGSDPGAAGAPAAATGAPGRLNHRLPGIAVEYAAPELLSKPTDAEVFHLVIAHGMDEEELPVYDEKVDVWSLGALLFEALTGCQPFLADGAAEMAAVVAERLQARDAESGLPLFLARAGGLSADAKDFVARCLDPSPAARPAARDLLAHPWISRRASLAAEGGAGGAIAVTASAGAGASSAHGGLEGAAPLLVPCVAGGAQGPPHSSASSVATGAPCAPKGGEASPRAGPLPRCSSAGDALASPHLTTRSHTGRLEGSRPGTRAASAAALAATALAGGALGEAVC